MPDKENLFEEYSYYVGEELTCSRTPKKYGTWRSELQAQIQAAQVKQTEQSKPKHHKLITLHCIYELTPAPWGDDYRFVVGYPDEDDAKTVLACLKSVNINFSCYRIVEMQK